MSGWRRGRTRAPSRATGWRRSWRSSTGWSAATTRGLRTCDLRHERLAGLHLEGQVKRSLVLAALIAAVVVPGAGSSRAGSTPRVLAIHFSQEVNPVTQGWLSSQLD